ncbi:MAG: hypothetical protein ABEJ69_01745 [Candidatus Nanohaloarchaea archaeon]
MNSRKGQYLAIETVFSFGLGLIVAIAVITGFNNFRVGALDTAEASQVKVVQAKVNDAVYSMGYMNSQSEGSIVLELPERIAGQNYQMSWEGGVLDIYVSGTTYSTSYDYLNSTHSFDGSSDGGTVNILKRGNQYLLRDR